MLYQKSLPNTTASADNLQVPRTPGRWQPGIPRTGQDGNRYLQTTEYAFCSAALPRLICQWVVILGNKVRSNTIGCNPSMQWNYPLIPHENNWYAICLGLTSSTFWWIPQPFHRPTTRARARNTSSNKSQQSPIFQIYNTTPHGRICTNAP